MSGQRQWCLLVACFLLLGLCSGRCFAEAGGRAHNNHLLRAVEWLTDPSNSVSEWTDGHRLGAAEFLYYCLEIVDERHRPAVKMRMTSILESLTQTLQAKPSTEQRPSGILERSLLLRALLKDTKDVAYEQLVNSIVKLDANNGLSLMMAGQLAFERGHFRRCIDLCDKAMSRRAFTLYDREARKRIVAALERAKLLNHEMKRAVLSRTYPWVEIAMFIRHAMLLSFLDNLKELVRPDSSSAEFYPRKYLSLVASQRPQGYGLDVHWLQSRFRSFAPDNTRSIESLQSLMRGEMDLLEKQGKFFLKETTAIEHLADAGSGREVNEFLDSPDAWEKRVLLSDKGPSEIPNSDVWWDFWKKVSDHVSSERDVQAPSENAVLPRARVPWPGVKEPGHPKRGSTPRRCFFCGSALKGNQRKCPVCGKKVMRRSTSLPFPGGD